jgi:hypothetical protein
MFSLGGRLAHRQDRGGGGHRIGDADDRFLRDTRLAAPDHREDAGADEGEQQAHPVNHRGVRVAARHREQQGDGAAERGDLRQGEIDEDHPTLDDVQAEIRMNARQDQARRERSGQKFEDLAERQVGHPQRPVSGLSVETRRLMS